MIDLDADSDEENGAYQAETLTIAHRKRAKIESPLAGCAQGSGGPQFPRKCVTHIPNLSSTRKVTLQTDVSSGSMRDASIRGGDDVVNALHQMTHQRMGASKHQLASYLEQRYLVCE